MKAIKIKSENQSKKIRKKKDIKYVIFHYTGMQSTIESLNRLIKKRFKVSAHYLIDRSGKIFQLVDDLKVSWHAGKSKWKNISNLNKFSIGIELQNKGHNLGYQKFSKVQIRQLVKLSLIIKKKYNIKKENFLGHSDIAPLRKIDPGEKFPWEHLNKKGMGIWYKKLNLNNSKKHKNNLRPVFFKRLKKIGYRYFSLSKKKRSDQIVIKAFQRKFLPNKVSGRIDEKTFKISEFLSKA
tara:strand:+ start:1955 stop:2668 length:714 start_codon:yes stop_codon:yes gene_type:complete